VHEILRRPLNVLRASQPLQTLDHCSAPLGDTACDQIVFQAVDKFRSHIPAVPLLPMHWILVEDIQQTHQEDGMSHKLAAYFHQDIHTADKSRDM